MSRPSLTTFVRRVLQPYVASRKPRALVLAVSGGPDSMALLSAAAFCKLDVQLVACGVDHGLRPEAAQELDIAEAWALRAGILFERTSVQIARTANVQESARRVRYQALAAVASKVGALAVVTGHHGDDQAETVLLRLLRGGGVRGLGAMRVQSTVPGASSIDLLRPMLGARRTDVALHIARHGIAAAQDPSNHNPRFLRVRVRHELLPLLEQLNRGVVEHLISLAEQVQRIDMNGDLSSALHLGRRHVKALEALPSKGEGAEVLLPGGLVVQWDRDHVKDRKSKPRRAPRIALDSPADPE